MITCFLKYIINPKQAETFEDYGTRWIALVERFGGQHHGLFLPGEGASNVALALFSFPSLAEYERYRKASFKDPECQELFALAKETECFLSYERSFFRPVLKSTTAA